MKMHSSTALFCASMFLLYSCSKNKNTNTDQLSSLGKATITGVVSAKLVDTLGSTTLQNTPEGTMIQAWVDTRDFVVNPVSGSNYAKRVYTSTTVGGIYTLTVDVSKNLPAMVHVVPQTFAAGVLMKMTTSPFELYYARKTFTAPVFDIQVLEGASVAKDITYSW